VHRDLFVTANAERADGVAGLALGVVSDGGNWVVDWRRNSL
jgi:hypothetical protein